MAKNPNWMHGDNVTNTAKEAAWRALAGDRSPQRAWYYSFSFKEEGELGALLTTLRDIFWDAKKSRVVKDVDVKAEHLSALPGVPILRVSMPDRFVASFLVGDKQFVLYKASIDGNVIDFGYLWGGLRDSVHKGSATVLGDAVRLMAADDAPPPAALLRHAEQRVVPAPARVRVEAVVVPPPSRPAAPRPADPREVPAVPDPADVEALPPDPTTETHVPRVTTRITRRARPPHSSGWEVFGGRPEAPPPAPPEVHSVTPAAAPKPDEDDGLPEDTSDRTFHIVVALMAVLVFLIIGSYFLSAS